MKLKLNDLQSLKQSLKKEDFENVIRAIKKMELEEIDLEGWVLDDIPIERSYGFYNSKTDEAFDYEEDVEGQLMPHYYKYPHKSKDITQIRTETVREAIKNYEL